MACKFFWEGTKCDALTHDIALHHPKTFGTLYELEK